MLRKASKNVVVAIRREDPKRVWERRAPLTPSDVAHLLRRNPHLNVLVAPCHRRVFRPEEYEKAGAVVTPNWASVADIVLGIKEIPLEELAQTPATHLMFSHTHKGQPYNTPLLSRFVAPSSSPNNNGVYPTLIDYELLTNDKGERTVGFGWYAGAAGVLESLSSMAHYHLEMGIASPFLYTPRPHSASSLKHAQKQLRKLGDIIAQHGTPEPLGPFVIGLTGSGNVAKGCLAMLAELPVQFVKVDELDALVRNPDADRRKIYVVHAKPQDYFTRTDGLDYSREHYYANPQSYISTFHERVAPYLTLLLHGAGWAPGFPRLITNAQLETTLLKARELGGLRGLNVGDISCDIEGGLEFLTRSTTLSSPFYKVPTANASLAPVQMMSVDILPTSLPYEASKSFSERLVPYVERLLQGEARQGDGYHKALDDATIARDGVLKERHAWLQGSVDAFYAAAAPSASAAASPASPKVDVATESAPSAVGGGARKKRILMLGSGMVAKPAVDLIAGREGIELVIASNSLPELQNLVKGHGDNVKYRVADVSDVANYVHLVEESDVVISLLPVSFHPTVGELCVKHKKHLVTASYISPAMAALDGSAKAADVLLLNEIGLDPGIDHCSAIRLLEEIRAAGQVVKSFTSFCGGLPAPGPESAVPLRYKFSWRPQGVLSAALNGARFKVDGQVRHVDGKDLLKSVFARVPVGGAAVGGALEGLPNRDSMPYCGVYGMEEGGMRSVVRGTLRYPGFSALMSSFHALGLLEPSAQITLSSWPELISESLRVKYARQGLSSPPLIHDALPSTSLPDALDALVWLGLLPSTPLLDRLAGYSGRPRNEWQATGPMPPLPKGPCAPLDLFAHLLAPKLAYKPGERDMVVLSHEIIASSSSSSSSSSPYPEEEFVYTSELVTTGDALQGSAMSRTVGIPVGIAAVRVALGGVPSDVRGVRGPGDTKSVWGAVLEGLEGVGLGMVERVRRVRRGGAEGTVEGALKASLLEGGRVSGGVSGSVGSEGERRGAEAMMG